MAVCKMIHVIIFVIKFSQQLEVHSLTLIIILLIIIIIDSSLIKSSLVF